MTGCSSVTPIPTETKTSPSALGVGSSWVSYMDGMVMMYVPMGEFVMGRDDGDGVEQPVHVVYLDAFWIDKMEITNAMYGECVGTGICDPPVSFGSYTQERYYGQPFFGDYPVNYVTWHEAQDYCAWRGARLPTEAEWEKAASWDDDRNERRLYSWGEKISCAFANYKGRDGECIGDTTKVGSYPLGASFYGVMDMVGNVSEWVADWYDDNFYNTSPLINPMGPDASPSSSRSVKGGSWYASDYFSRLSYRIGLPPSLAVYGLGFRCARDASP